MKTTATIVVTKLNAMSKTSFAKGEEIHRERAVTLDKVDEYVEQCHHNAEADGDTILVEVFGF